MTRQHARAAELHRAAVRGERHRDRGTRRRTRIARALQVVRPLAWILIASAAVLAGIGVAADWTELRSAAIVVAAIAAVSAVFLVGSTSYDIALGLQRDSVVVGERAFGSVTVKNTGSRALPPARIVLPVGPGRGTFDVESLAPREKQEELFSIPTTTRGLITVGPVSVLRGDPLGLYERRDTRRDGMTLYVHPRTVALEGVSVGAIRDLEGLPTTDLASDDVSFHALREYQPGDDLRHVHWKATARAGSVMVRQYEQTRRSTVVIGLALHPGDYADAAEFELAVSIAASVGLRALASVPDISVIIPGRRVNAVTPRRLLDEFSTVSTLRATGTDMHGVTIGMAVARDTLATAVIVCGSSVNAANMRAAAARMPSGVRTIIIQAAPAQLPQLRRIGDAFAVTVGSLDELPAAVRRVMS